MLVTDRSLASDLVTAVAQAAGAGVNAVQVREKDLPAKILLDMARALRRVLPPHVLLIMNDRVDVALAAGIRAVQLPELGLPVAEARHLLGQEALIGRSVHSWEEAVRAQDEGADYVVLGSIYPTPSHPQLSPLGTEVLAQVATSLTIPVIAIGGITVDKVKEVIQAGAAGVAVIRAILGAEDPALAASRLRGALDEAWAEVQRG